MTSEQLDKLRGHTPGPWWWYEFPHRQTGDDGFGLLGEDGYGILWTDAPNAPPSFHECNARLIAAAPDLLAHIDELTAERDRLAIELSVLNGSSCAEEQRMGNGPCGACNDCLRAERDRLREALWKAVEWMRESCSGDEYIVDNWYTDAREALKEASDD